MKRKKKSHKQEKYIELRDSIDTFSKKIPLYNLFIDEEKDKVKTFSYCDMYVKNNDVVDNNKYKFKEGIELKDKVISCRKIILKPDKNQNKKLLAMIDAYRIMYNETICLFKYRRYMFKKHENKKEKLDVTKKKTKKLKKVKDMNEKEKEEYRKQREVKKKEREEDSIKMKNMSNEEKKEYKKQKREKNKIEKMSDEEREEYIRKKEEMEKIKGMSDKEKKEYDRQTREEYVKRVTSEDNYEIVTKFDIIRTYFLKEKMSSLAKNYKVPCHILEGAIKLACASYKSMLTNYEQGHIKRFTLRYLKKSKNSHIIDIEKTAVKSDTIYPTFLGCKLENKENTKYETDHACKIHYNVDRKIFTLLVPQTKKIIKNDSNDWICIDPGIRTFLTCKTNRGIVEIGKNISNKLKSKLEYIDSNEILKNKIINKKIEWKKDRKGHDKKIKIKELEKNQYNARQYIKNMVDDIQWKITNYLCKSYKNIVIGKWSTKDIIRKSDSVLTRKTKRISQSLCFYKFLQRLEYKCNIYSTNLRKQEENYTSKTCSNCGWINYKLNGKKRFNCNKCKKEMDRDYNGSRNIMIKSIAQIA